MDEKLKSALETIIEHCKQQETCDGCCFMFAGVDSCFFSFSELPCDWVIMDGDSHG